MPGGGEQPADEPLQMIIQPIPLEAKREGRVFD
jgi:hypothetical protein